MPQLDRIIIFPQIFYFFVLFIFLYFLLTFYLLPRFLIILKSRKKIIEIENRKRIASLNEINKNKLITIKALNKDLVKVKKSIYFDSFYLNTLSVDKKYSNFNLRVDQKIIKTFTEINLYFNKYSLDTFHYPSIFNPKS